MSTEPLTFPNLVTGFERYPQHAARSALFTRFTPGEWTNHCISSRFIEIRINLLELKQCNYFASLQRRRYQ